MSSRSGSLISFPATGNRAVGEVVQGKVKTGGSPAANIAHYRPDLVLKHARATRNVVTVARRMGCRANVVFLVVLDRLEVLEQAIGSRAA